MFDITKTPLEWQTRAGGDTVAANSSVDFEFTVPDNNKDKTFLLMFAPGLADGNQLQLGVGGSTLTTIDGGIMAAINDLFPIHIEVAKSQTLTGSWVDKSGSGFTAPSLSIAYTTQ